MCEGALNKPSSTALTVLNSLSGMASIGGNLLVLLTIYKQPRLHTISNCFIASLAVADIIVGLVINPIWATRSAMNIWEEKEPLTIASECLAAHTVVATSLNLCAVSIDRYLAVVKVFRYDTSLSERRCRIIICSIWRVWLLFLAPWYKIRWTYKSLGLWGVQSPFSFLYVSLLTATFTFQGRIQDFF